MSPRQSNNESLSEPLLQSALSSTSSENEALSQELVDASSPQEKPPISRNVHLTLLYTGFAFAGRSIWIQSVLAAFVYFLKNNLEAVGYITAVMGLSQLVCSFPAAFIADYHRRDFMLKIASVFGVAAIVVTLYALHTRQYVHLVMALTIWGCSWGIANTSLSALFADSVPTGQRSYYFTQRATLVTGGFTAGPIVSLIMFAVLGDTWTVRDCAIVMSVGQIVCFPAVIMLCFFSDDFIEHHHEEELNNGNIQADGNEGEESEDRLISSEPIENAATNTLDCSEVEAALPTERQPWLSEQRQIAVSIAIADVVGGLAAGMSIRYFPIFFVDYLHLGPVKVQVLYVLSPMLGAFAMKMAQRLSTTYGRCHVSALFKWIGASLMYCVILAFHFGLPKWVTCTLYVLRTIFINSTGALTKSVLMDNVPKKERAKWAALESLNMVGKDGRFRTLSLSSNSNDSC